MKDGVNPINTVSKIFSQRHDPNNSDGRFQHGPHGVLRCESTILYYDGDLWAWGSVSTNTTVEGEEEGEELSEDMIPFQFSSSGWCIDDVKGGAASGPSLRGSKSRK